ncbi:MAG: C39 family peptidase [Patescibacteria group bacterium]|nr:C39 family peptidase [Patescibacteria group bacterium]
MKLKAERIKKFFAIISIISLVGLISYQIFIVFFLGRPSKIENQKNKETKIQKTFNLEVQNEEEILINTENQNIPESQILPEKFDLPMSFVPQAPTAIWDELHNNACEEAALIMVHYFLKGEKLTKEIAEKEIQDLVAWQIKNWGAHKDLTIAEVGKLAKEYYGWQKIRILDKITIEEIKKELSKGNPIIIPTAGRLLKNPYYRQPGPYYHMLVARGYTKDRIITNDPGTKRGEKFSYPSEILYQAIHDWPGEDKDILEGEKTVLVIEK